MCRIEIEIG